MHKLIEGKAPIIAGVTVSTGGGQDGGVPTRAAPVCGLGPGLTSPTPPLSGRKPSPHPPYHGSRTPPSSRAPTRSASTHQAGARAGRAVWTWWMSRATCRATSTRAPTTRRCRGASSQQGLPSPGPLTTSTSLHSCAHRQNSDLGLGGRRAAGLPPTQPSRPLDPSFGP